MNNAPPTPVRPHVCFTSNLSCSGVFPCDACAMVIKQNVIVAALRAAQTAFAAEMEAAFRERRTVNLIVLAETFFRGWAQGWKDLHAGMMAEPPEQRPFGLTDVGKLVAMAEAYRDMQEQKATFADMFSGQSATPPQAYEKAHEAGKNVSPPAPPFATSSHVVGADTEGSKAAEPEFRPEMVIPSAADVSKADEQLALFGADDVVRSAVLTDLNGAGSKTST